MRKIKIEASDGEVMIGHLPESWGEVPLQPYVALALTAQAAPPGVAPTAHVFASEAGCQALAHLLGLPTAAPFLADLSLLLEVYEAAPWLFVGELPASAEPAPTFTHLGVSYTYGGGLEHVTGGQWEALATFLRASAAAPLSCVPQLLAVLYQPTGQPQTAEAVRAAALAFETLPMGVAWPAVQNFLMRAQPLALSIQRFFAARPQVEQAVHALEMLLTPPTSGRFRFSWNMGRWLLKQWLKLVKRQIRTFLSLSATTAKAPSWLTSPAAS